MGAAITIAWLEHMPVELRAAGRCGDAAQVRRLPWCWGASRQDAACQNGTDRETLLDWVHCYNAAGIHGLISRKPPSAAAKASQAQMSELRDLVL